MPSPGGKVAPEGGRKRNGVHWKSGIGLQLIRHCEITTRIPLQSAALTASPREKRWVLPHRNNVPTNCNLNRSKLAIGLIIYHSIGNRKWERKNLTQLAVVISCLLRYNID